MKIGLSKKRGLTAGTFQLTRDDIERQAVQDTATFAQLYAERFNKSIRDPLDVDLMAELLWGVTVSYEIIPQSNPQEEILGYYDRKQKKIIVDPEICKYEGRTTFTVAHEIGHLSLHSALDMFPQQTIAQRGTRDQTGRLEWQATHYAASLLAPRERVFEILRSRSLLAANVMQPVDLRAPRARSAKHFRSFAAGFGNPPRRSRCAARS